SNPALLRLPANDFPTFCAQPEAEKPVQGRRLRESERSSGLVRVVEVNKKCLVVAHGTLWRQSFNYETSSRAATIANSFKYLLADNNIALRVAGDYPRAQHE